MKKPSKKWIVVAASVGVIASTFATYTDKPMADEFIFNDENVSITSIVDRYIEVNGNVFAADGTFICEGEDITEEIAEELTETAEESFEEAVYAEPTEEPQEQTAEEVSQPETTEATTEAAVEQPAQAPVADAPAACANYDFTGKAVVTASGYVNIRKSGDISAEKVGQIDQGGILTVVEKGDDWSHITSGSVDGYIKSEFLAFGSDAETYAKNNLTRVAVVNTSALRLRADQSTDSEELKLLSNGDHLTILNIGDAWTKVQVGDKTGYVKNEYIMISYNMPTAKAVSEPAATATATETTEATATETTTEAPAGITTAPASSQGQEIANYAVQFVGNPYVWGGTSLTNGADCSGFVQTIYKNFGYSLPRTADVQGTVGTRVDLSAVAPGDLIFYDHGTGSIKHVAIYIGDGKVVHASSSRTGIIISNMNYNKPCRAVRIVN